MAPRLRTAARRALKGLASGVGALLLSAGIVSAATTFGTSSITTTGTLQVDGNSTFDTNTMFVDATNNRVGVGTATPAAAFSVGTSSALQVDSSGNLVTTGTLSAFSSASNADKITISANTSSSATQIGTLTSGDLTAARTWSFPDAAGAVIIDTAVQTLTNKTLTTPKIGTALYDANGNAILNLSPIGSPANALTVKNAVAGNSPSLSAEGSDGNVSMTFFPKGTGSVVVSSTSANADKLALIANTSSSTGFAGTFTSGDLTGDRTWTFPDVTGAIVLDSNVQTLQQKTYLNPKINGTLQDVNGSGMISFSAVSSAVNGFTAMNAVATADPVFSATGTDANIDLRLQAKGSGNIFIQNTTANADYLVLQPQSTGSNSFIGTLTTADLTGNRTWTFPDVDGTVTLTGATQTLSGKTLQQPLIVAPSASNQAEIVRGLASQSGNLTEWQDSSSTVLASVSAAGNLSVPTLSIGGGAAITKHLSGTGAVGNAGTNITSGNCISDNISVTGAATGDSVVATPVNGLENLLNFIAFVSGANTVEVRLCNPSAGNVVSNDRTWRVDVWKH